MLFGFSWKLYHQPRKNGTNMECLQFLDGKKKPLTNLAMLPIINGSPTEWENLYASAKEAEKLRRKIFKDGKTIISFDLQLYVNAIWLEERNDIKDLFVFRMGE